MGSCFINAGQKPSVPKFSKLTLLLEDSSKFYVDKLLLKNDSMERIMPYKFDSTVTNATPYGYDSLKNGTYEVTVKSLLDNVVKFSINLTSDSVLYVDKSLLPSFKNVPDALPLVSELANGDSLIVTYTSIGCFHNYIEKSVIYKHESGFDIKFSTDTSKNHEIEQLITIRRTLPVSFADSLKHLAKACTNAFQKQQKILNHYKTALMAAKNMEDSVNANSQIPYSTTSSDIYFRKGNKVFYLTSKVILEIPYYYHFIAAMKLFN